ncbi:MAG: class I poly(R)-hydroxyalkanoic acid synthase [Rubrivivax sp.]
MANKRNPGATAPADPAGAFGAAVGEMVKSFGGLSLPVQKLGELQGDYLKAATEIWNDALQRMQGKGAPPLPDRRFATQPWLSNPAAAYTAQMYLLNARTLMQMAESVQGDPKTRARIRFAVQQWIDAASPANFLATNPEALQKALDTKGESIAAGLGHLLEDLQKGHVSQTDESVFEVGRNVATTEGSVVFENGFFQLIEYKPLTAKVHERPMLFVPPCINKYYILDLQPENSVIRHTVEQGHRVFVMSWRNPDESMKSATWDDYIGQGPITAIDVVRRITGAKTINTLGFCVGGTILATALAVLAARGEQPAHSVTLLTTLLDFSDTGILDIFVDEASVQLREMTIGAQAPGGPGLLKGQELATTFSFLRPNDLVWNYVVGNYLKGETPPPFDLLYWNGDSTNLPGPMYCWYLRHMYLQNELKKPGALTVCGEKVDLGKIQAPFFVYGSREDHIVPWKAAYASIPLIKGKKRFVLGASGHIAGVINPPAKGKRSHWVSDKTPADADDWLDTATEKPGSWWPEWTGWLKPLGGRLVAAPKAQGSRRFKPIEPAPGRYVKAKA